MYQNTNEGSEEAGNLASFRPTVYPSLIAEVSFNHHFGTNGLFAHGVMYTILARDTDFDLQQILFSEAAYQQFGKERLKFDQPIHEVTAKYLRMIHDESTQYQTIMECDPHNFESLIGIQLAGTLARSIDPAFLIFSLIIATIAARHQDIRGFTKRRKGGFLLLFLAIDIAISFLAAIPSP